MAYITYENFYNSYLIKNGQQGNETNLGKGPDQLKKELDETVILLNMATGIYPAEWSSAANYIESSYVTYNSKYYRSKTGTISSPNKNKTPGNNADWAEVFVPGVEKLKTARKLNGVSFNGTSDITVPTNLSISATGTTNVILSDTGNDATIVGATTTAAGLVTTGSQTFNGIKTFANSPVVPTPETSDSSGKAASTAYVKNVVGTAAPTFEVRSLSAAQHNNLMMDINGDLYTACGHEASYSSWGTGRGVSGAVLYGLDNIAKVTFPNLPAGVSMVDYGGNGHTGNYARFDNNWLYTWGNNNFGDCGLGHTSPVPVPTLALTDCAKVWSAGFEGYSVSNSTMIIQKTNGKVYGCGENDNGELGLGNFTASITTFTEMTWCGINPMFVKGSNGYGGVTVCQKADKSVWACGYQHSGCVFNKVSSASGLSVPVNISNNIGGSGGVISGRVLDFWHNYAHYATSETVSPNSYILYTGASDVMTYLWGVGYNGWGQLKTGSTLTSTIPVQLLAVTSAEFKDIDIFGGGTPSIRYLKSNGELWVWGYNSFGQLGVGNTSSVLTSTRAATGVSELLCKRMASHTHSWYNQSFIRKTDGFLYGCGHNSAYYLGLGDTTDKTTFQKIHIPVKDGIVKEIGSFTTNSYGRVLIAITENNSIYVWGTNGNAGITTTGGQRYLRYPTKMNFLTRNV